MKTLKNYQSQYRRATTRNGRAKAMNSAMLNLSEPDKKRFLKWQMENMSIWRD